MTTSRQKELLKLHSRIRRCRKCPLCKSRLNAVPGEGPLNASLMIIGEAPGKEEDIQGHPLVGRSGKFFDSLLEKTGLSRKDIYITSSVKCRPQNNRTPHANELKICKHAWLDKQIACLNPKIIVLLGKVSVKQVLGADLKLDTIHGLIIRHNNLSCFPTYHPAAGMRFPKVRTKMFQDFKKLKRGTTKLQKNNPHCSAFQYGLSIPNGR
jgi:uracil-DNA glycosylase family 4